MLCFIVQKKTRTSLGQVHRSFFTDSWNCGFRKVINTRLKPQCFLSNDVSSIIIICWVGFLNIELAVYYTEYRLYCIDLLIEISKKLHEFLISADDDSVRNPAYNKICKRVLRPLIGIWKSWLRVRHGTSLNDHLHQIIWESYEVTFGILPAQWAFSWSELPFTMLQLSQTSQILIFDGHWMTSWLYKSLKSKFSRFPSTSCLLRFSQSGPNFFERRFSQTLSEYKSDKSLQVWLWSVFNTWDLTQEINWFDR